MFQQSKHELSQGFAAAPYHDPDVPLRFSYYSDHPLAAEIEAIGDAAEVIQRRRGIPGTVSRTFFE